MSLPIDWKEESKRFNEAASYYDRYRPGYPDALVQCLIRETGILPGAKLLEIGAGSGKATLQFADGGYEILCLEPGEDQVREGRRRFEKNPDIRFVASRFEEWEEPKSAFDVVFSAQAFHWVPKPAGFVKSAHALKPGGFLCLFWNMYLASGDGEEDAIVSGECSGLLDIKTPAQCEERIARITDEMDASGYFEKTRVYRFPWSQTYNAEQFVGLIKTGNGYLRLNEKDRRQVEEELSGRINRNGGSIDRSYLSVLYIARKAGKAHCL
jgi:ubiquinone/menaquinone biosynthesis C-methylase UbiE